MLAHDSASPDFCRYVGQGFEMAIYSGDRRHLPVLLDEAVGMLAIRPWGRYIDATFGAGGYSQAIVSAYENTEVLALDRDPSAISGGAALVREAAGRLTLASSRFSQIAEIARENGFDRVDGVVFDIGVSSMQIDASDRGFSFRREGPLDMRMSLEGVSASDIVNAYDAHRLAQVLRSYGEERHAGRIARAIVAARQEAPIHTTLALQRIVAAAVPRSAETIDPATRTFQALRIAVNDELGELVRGLAGAASLLAPGGRLVVVSFHSLEDRIVKRFLQGRTAPERVASRHLPGTAARPRAFARLGGPITAGPAEISGNPRARSAKLRWAERGEGELPSDLSALDDLAGLPEARPHRGPRP